MKKVLLIVLTMTMFIAQKTLAQEGRTYRDIAYDYLMQNNVFNDETGWSIASDDYSKMPNGGYLVTLVFSKTTKYYEEGLVNNQVQAYGAVFNVGVKKGLIAHNNTKTKRFLVFTDKYGTAHNYVLSTYEPIVQFWNNNVWIMNKGHFEDIHMDFHCNFACYSLNGDLLWEKSGIAAISMEGTENNLYMGGVYTKDKRSFVATVNKRTFEYKEKTGETNVIPFSVKLEPNGVEISEKDEKSNVSTYTIPYEENDRQFQKNLLSQKLKKLENGVSTGDIESIRELANRCYEGIGVEKNIPRGLYLYSKLSSAIDEREKEILLSHKDDILKDKMIIGQLSKDYIPYSSNPDERWNVLQCEAASINGNTKAKLEMIDRYSSGKGVEKNESKANEIIENMVFFASSETLVKIGMIYLDSSKSIYNIEKGIEFLEKAASNGNAEAMLKLGQYYGNSTLGKKGEKESIKWLEQAASQGNVEAQIYMGNCYLNGIGVKKNKKLAFEMFSKAASQQSSEGIKQLILCYIQGIGIKQDFVTAQQLIGGLSNESEGYYMTGILLQAQRRYQEALNAYKNSREPEAREAYDKLHTWWKNNNYPSR